MDFSADRTRVRVDIPLVEGRLYRLSDIHFQGDLPDAVGERLQALRRDLRGQAYNRSQLLVIQSRLEEIYGNLGYAEMTVDVTEERLLAPDGILLEAAITSGEAYTIGDIQVRGNAKTQEAFIRRRLKLQSLIELSHS